MIRPSLAAVALLGVGLLSACASTTSGTPAGSPQPATPSTHSRSPLPSVSAPPATSPNTTGVSSAAVSSGSTEPAQPVRTKVVTASDGSVYAILVWAEQRSDDCAAHAYGQVASFVATHRCTNIHQLLATTAIDGRAVGFAQNSVGFGGGVNAAYRSAGKFTMLVSANGTGNLNDLMREGYRLPAGPDHVPSPDAFKAMGQDAGVVVTDAWYLIGPTPANDPALVKFAEDIFLQI